MSSLAPSVTSLSYPITCALSAGPTGAEQYLRKKRPDRNIAVDAMGDYAPKTVVQGAVEPVSVAAEGPH